MCKPMFTVMFDYYEYSDEGFFIGENTDYHDFCTLSDAEDCCHELNNADDVKKAWILQA